MGACSYPGAMSTAPPPGPPPQDPPSGSGGPGPWGPPGGPGGPGGSGGGGWGSPQSWQPPPPPPRRSRTGLYVGVAVAVVLALVLAGGLGAAVLLGGDDEQQAPASQAPTPPEPTGTLPPAPDGLQDFYDQELDWSDCAGGECATMTVPLDYAEPDGETIDIAVIRVPARDRDNRVGQLVMNPGGPGASGIEYARAGALAAGADLARVYDLVGFDPRGVGSSSAVSCGPTELLDRLIAADPDPDSAAEQREVDTLNAEFGRTCAADTGALIEHVSTVEAARDMDVLRAALREPELDYLGTSYGTTLGSTYAQLFPQNVGRMVLDAAVTPDKDPVTTTRDQLGGFQTALTAYLESCVEGECPLGDTVAEAEEGMSDLLEQLDADPLPTQDGRELTEGRAVYGIFLPLYVPTLWPTLTQSLTAALQGDGSALGILSDQYVSRGPDSYRGNLYDALPAVNCLDVDPDAPQPDPADHVDDFEQVSPVFGRIFAAGLAGCENWPVKPTQAPPTIRAEGAAPIVVVGTTRDPATPYQWAEELSAALESGVLVSRDGDGHAGFQQGNQCVDDAVNDFMIDGTVPEDGLRC